MELVTMLIQVAAENAPAIIAAIHGVGGSARDVGPMLQMDQAMIDADAKQLKAEQDPPTAP